MTNLIKLRKDLRPETKRNIDSYIKKYNLKNMLVLASSGTTQKSEDIIYFIELSSMKGHAAIIAKKFNMTSKSKVLCVLPECFMGSLSSYFRCEVSEASFIKEDWSIKKIKTNLDENRISHLSLVPTQVYDLCEKKITPNKELEYCFVGGSELSVKLKDQFMNLGWPLYETYGLTELCSQVATSRSEKNSKGHQVLEFIDYKISENSPLLLKSEFHFSYKMISGEEKHNIFSYQRFCNQDGYFITTDIAKEVVKGVISISGREDDFVKINSKFINLKQVERKILALDNVLQEGEFYIKAVDDERSGKSLQLVSLKMLDLESINALLDYKIASLLVTKEMKRTQSGKLIRI